MAKKALITGLSGQDGTYLTQLLHSKGYEIYGVDRRKADSTMDYRKIQIYADAKVKLLTGDATDPDSMRNIIKTVKPDEIYNLAAMSFVKASWDIPVSTFDINARAVVHLLEIIRQECPETRYYQASTSEMFGKVLQTPQNESTPFYPRSPYGVAKLAAHWATVNYRESYNLHASSGILFNHECFFSDTPVIIKSSQGDIDIVYISSLVSNRTDINSDSTRLTKDYTSLNIDIWDGNSFVKLKTVSRKKLNSLQNEEDQSRQITISPNVLVSTTPNHKVIKTSDRVVQAKDITEGDSLILGKYPDEQGSKEVTTEFAELLGLLVGDGYVGTKIQLTSNDLDIQNRFIYLAKKTFFNVFYSITSYTSGFGGISTQIKLYGISENQSKYIREMIYEDRTKHKKVPGLILNSSSEIQAAFLKGYYLADGLKKDNTSYEYKSFKTNSPLLAQGILFLISNTIKSGYSINAFEQNDKIYYQINFQSPNKTNAMGNHLELPKHIVKKIIKREEDNQHVFDVETESGVVMAGIGVGVIGNSPFRGLEFLTRKVTYGAAKIKLGLEKVLKLGNLDAQRDWGHAKDYVEAMWLMLQQDQPGDYVICTGKTHLVRDFVRLAFRSLDLDWEKYVEIDSAHFRPAEVDLLLGDASKAETNLGWIRKYDLEKLIEDMTSSDYNLLKKMV